MCLAEPLCARSFFIALLYKQQLFLYRTNGVIIFYPLLYISTRHIEKVEGGERDTQLVHVNEATAV